MSTSALAERFTTVLRPGMTVVLGDGAGTVGCLEDSTSVCAALSEAARDVGSVRLVVGWLPVPAEGLEPDAFAEVIALMPNGGGRRLLRSPSARFVPLRLSAWPALLAGPLRPDLLITRLVQRDGSLWFGSEVSFQKGLVEAATPVWAVVDDRSPAASAEDALNPDQVHVIGISHDGPAHQHREPEPVHEALADAVLRFVPSGARLQYGPGPLGTALLRRAKVPLHLDTGLLTDGVVDLERRGLLIGNPLATYLVDTDVLYDWAEGRPILRGIEHTHDLTRLSHGAPLIAVNAAIEIDPWGQVNVEGIGEKVVGGVGGHPDFCAAAKMSKGGLSIIAVPAVRDGDSPLVERLSRPASTPAHDIDLVVTEHGHADLRNADWSQRRTLLEQLLGA